MDEGGVDVRKCAAVLIGVGEPKQLGKLDSPAKGAERIAAWLEGEGFDVTCLTDDEDPVTAEMVRDALKRYVTKPARYDLLLVYFSGHGLWKARADHWLLSDAPTDPSAAVNLRASEQVAQWSGIPNVVFVSDACRSLPNSRATESIDGITALPNHDDFPETTKVDKFLATSASRAAYEFAIDGETRSLLTHALRAAYREATEDMILEVQHGPARVRVVPNRRLEAFLQAKIDAILIARGDPSLAQTIKAEVPSGDEVYIARVDEPPPDDGTGPPDRSPRPAAPTTDPRRRLREDTRRRLDRVLGTGSDAETATVLRKRASPALEQALQSRKPVASLDHFETGVGFSLRGARVKSAIATGPRGPDGSYVDILRGTGTARWPALLRLSTDRPGVTVLAQLEDGRGVVLPMLYGYIGHAVVDESGLSNVSYVPNHGTPSRGPEPYEMWAHKLNERWRRYERRKPQVDRLRALVALAVEAGTFTVGSAREGENLAHLIRAEKSIDPTLGLYAAHAYAQAGAYTREDANESVQSVRRFMRGDLGLDLFDVQALSTRRGAPTEHAPRVPFCPILTQTWSLLEPRGIELHPILRSARPHLCNALWTTFRAEATERLFEAIQRGELS